MKLVNDDYTTTVKNIVYQCKSNSEDLSYSTHVNLDNLEYLVNNNEKERLNDLFAHIEHNYDAYHREDYRNKVHYMLKAVSLIRKYGELLNNLSASSLSLLVSEIPFEVDNDRNENRFRVLASDDFLSEVRLLSNRFLPQETICTFLQHFDKKDIKRINEESLDKFRNEELNKLEKNKNKYFENSLNVYEYTEYLDNEELYKNGLK